MPLIVNCPICKTPVEWAPSSAFKPFCSERCKLIDLGDWAAEKHAIPVKSDNELANFDEFDIDEADFFKE